MAEAVGYALNQWNELNVFISDGTVHAVLCSPLITGGVRRVTGTAQEGTGPGNRHAALRPRFAVAGTAPAEQVAPAIQACLTRQVLRAEFIERKLAGETAPARLALITQSSIG
jgi:hypothetical protein